MTGDGSAVYDTEIDAELIRWAERIEQRGLVVPALVMFESLKPLGGLLSAMTLFAQPFLMVLGMRFSPKIAELLASREGIDRFIALLEMRNSKQAPERTDS